MQFPKWVSKGTKDQQASNRLWFIINTLAISHAHRGSMKMLCDALGVHHTTVSNYIVKGQFSLAMAGRFERMFRVPAEHLTDPMSIPVTKTPA